MATNDETLSTAPTSGGNDPDELLKKPATPEPRGPVVTDEELVHRYTYHAPSGQARDLHQGIRSEFLWFARFLNQNLPEGRSKALAHTALEQASFHAHAAVARDPSLHDEAATD